jgi:hypothetical protein
MATSQVFFVQVCPHGYIFQCSYDLFKYFWWSVFSPLLRGSLTLSKIFDPWLFAIGCLHYNFDKVMLRYFWQSVIWHSDPLSVLTFWNFLMWPQFVEIIIFISFHFLRVFSVSLRPGPLKSNVALRGCIKTFFGAWKWNLAAILSNWRSKMFG